MRYSITKSLLFSAIAVTALQFAACKGGKTTDADKDSVTVVDSTVMPPAPAPVAAPVTVTSDDTLAVAVKDATKDFPGVNVTISNGEITLTGDIKRDQLPTLMQSLNALRPKKINNNLTIK